MDLVVCMMSTFRQNKQEKRRCNPANDPKNISIVTKYRDLSSIGGKVIEGHRAECDDFKLIRC